MQCGVPGKMDDVEGIIEFMHEMLSDIFDVKQFLDLQPKILKNLKNQIDPVLLFAFIAQQPSWIDIIYF